MRTGIFNRLSGAAPAADLNNEGLGRTEDLGGLLNSFTCGIFEVGQSQRGVFSKGRSQAQSLV